MTTVTPQHAAGRHHDLAGRVVAVTGASRGLGRLLALELAGRGASVALLARDRTALAGVLDDLIADGAEASAVATACDVTDESSVRDALEHAAEAFGGIDAVIVNAGVAPPSRRAHNLPLDGWRQALEVNLTGGFATARAAYPHLARSARGRLVFTGSVMARTPRPGLSAYAASKAGMEGLARALAVDWAADGICVNVVAPGFFDVGMGAAFRADDRLRAQVSDRTLLGDVGAPDELVGVYAFLIGDAGGFVTGQTLGVDGGYGLR